MFKLKSEVLVGMMVVGGFLLLTLVVFGVSGVYVFRPGYTLHATFDFVGILDQGAPVRYAGVKVGEVKKVEIDPNGSSKKGGRVKVSMFIVKGVEVHENDRISIQGTHIMSEPHIAVEPAQDRGRLLTDGEVVKGISPISMDALIHQGEEILGKINRFLSQLETSLSGSDSPEILRDSLVNLSELLASLNQIVSGREEEYQNGLTHLSDSAQELSVILAKINKGEGTLGKLVTDDELYDELNAFVKEIKKHPWRLLKKS
ncbi:MAG: hypothetical protein COV74_10035 [Candidatus Omnitrophica bacterium CG11_big_fil_rev_8_21_14_0_20_45_26]|uniref:Mce/MlaD domain-containing protein n=1 Tax=Candidatus Abzuiibacterium crystallinum TaxID=1974748 RepID=A0A2H0LL31_9BACT|nr:MAG: hypothetical protein COV74_10035 [Candidatus Omnitrophica bacterium CG11_big_fil_rev_8_21_14_0_20_45_26]PIW63777.1 MAG: hypothetical protein COW12_08920 [Candidatus Omnitrophica bacterium CG12_big_fil_rev_8_21_14_0_65_45_16]